MRFILSAVIAGSLALTACGSNSDTAATDSSSTTAAAAQATGPTVDVKLVDFMIEPMNFDVTAGAVTFHVHNDGETPHNFVVETTDGKEIGKSKDLNKGQSDDVTMQIPVGTYDAICSKPGHESLGMKAALVAK